MASAGAEIWSYTISEDFAMVAAPNDEEIEQRSGAAYIYRLGVSPVSTEDLPSHDLIRNTHLETPYPNPFSQLTSIAYNLTDPSAVRIDVYDLVGRMVASVVEGVQAAGRYAAKWDGRSTEGQRVVSGVYLLRLIAVSGNNLVSETRKLLLVR